MERSLAQTTGGIAQRERAGGRRASRWQAMFIATIVVSIAACEWVFVYGDVAYGILFALGLAMLIHLVVSLFYLNRRIIDCADSLALIPLYILFTASLPWFLLDQQYLLPVVYSCILGLCLWHIYQKKLSLRELFGFSKDTLLRYSLIGIALGIPLGTVEYFILHPAPAFPIFEVKYFFRDMVYMLLFVGIGEELLFRGLIQRAMVGALGWKWGLFGASALFAVMHLSWRSSLELVFVFLAGLILGALYLKTKSLVAPIIVHGINNVMLVAVWPYIFTMGQ
ncbi:MAG: lysostaphin resistance A-like protein [Dehalococcoidia bacterium]